MELIYIAGAFFLGAIFHKAGAALWVKFKSYAATKAADIQPKL